MKLPPPYFSDSELALNSRPMQMQAPLRLKPSEASWPWWLCMLLGVSIGLAGFWLEWLG